MRLCCVPVPTAAGEGARGEDLQQGQAGAAFQGPSPAVPDPPLHPEQPPGLPGRAAADAATAGAGHTGAAGAGHSAGAGRGAAAAAPAWTARSHPRVPVPCQEAQANPNSRGSQHQGKQAASSQSGSRIKQSLVSLSPLLPTSQCSWLQSPLLAALCCCCATGQGGPAQADGHRPEQGSLCLCRGAEALREHAEDSCYQLGTQPHLLSSVAASAAF